MHIRREGMKMLSHFRKIFINFSPSHPATAYTYFFIPFHSMSVLIIKISLSLAPPHNFTAAAADVVKGAGREFFLKATPQHSLSAK